VPRLEHLADRAPGRIAAAQAGAATSLAATPGGSGLQSSIAQPCGMVSRTAPVTNGVRHVGGADAEATQPSAPLCGVCESVPATAVPGSA
jgi:hypothetical protein